MMRYYILNATGEPEPVNDMQLWGDWFTQNTAARIIAKSPVGEAVVSTVFLGIDHSFGGGVPLLFETLIFDGEHDGWMRRYTSKASAVAGHDRAVEALRDGRDPDEVDDVAPNAGSAS